MPIKFSPIKFPLKMRGVDVRNLEDLRENFDLNAAVAYFKDGKLIKWLEARYYDDEADEISSLDENAPDFREKLCSALGVTCDEKSSRNDGGIVYEMFQWDEDGNIISPFNATANTDGTDAEKEYQPVNQNKSAVDDELREIFATIFGNRKLWEVVDRDGKISTKEPTLTQKKMFLKMVCNGKYFENDLIFIRAVEDFSSGFAFTKDSFCIGGDFRKVVLSLAYALFDALNLLSNKYFNGIPKIERGIIKFADITSVNFSDWDSSLTKRQEADSLTINFALPAPEVKKFSFEDKNGKPLPAATSEGILMEQFEQVNLWNEIDEMEHSFKIDRYKVGNHLVDRKILWQIGKFLDFAKG